LDRLIDLIGDCRYSIHDLSRVQRSTKGFRTPRFNMAFELGLTIGAMRATSTDHQWHVLEAVPHRLAQSLSDLGGYDKVLIHSNTIDGVFESLLEMFAARPGPPVSEVAPMRRVYKAVRRYRLAQLPKDVFKAHCFRKLSVASFLELKAIAPRNA
jgi:hypothetical protein